MERANEPTRLGPAVTAGVIGVALVVAVAASTLRGRAHGLGPVSAAGLPPIEAPVEPGRFTDRFEATVFQKGNLHTHTTNSDGDSSPEEVYLWYRRHGYAFLSVTDHNFLTEAPRRVVGRRFASIPGEEITMNVKGKPVHVNALCIQRVIDGGTFPDVGAALSYAVREVLAQGGVALVNHPNFEWAFGADDLGAARGAQLLEIWSGHPFVRPEGDLFHPSEEAIWDAGLARGLGFAGVAVDDTHHVQRNVIDPAARPGRAWVEVFAAEPEPAAICAALGAGRLYSSNGAKLGRIAVADDVFGVTPETEGALVEFVGEHGEVLAESRTSGEEPVATYRLRGGEKRVRARVTNPNGKRAWTQAYAVGPKTTG